MPHILLVEDDPMNREMISRRLAWEGYQISIAGNGEQAVAMAQEVHPDLILMDIGLPVLNGWQATEAIKATPASQSIPIIALTAYALNEERQRSFDAGCDDFETKPINFAQLIGKMQRHLAGC
ncbi:chemotaxis protein CheY [Kouleothrix aurantiaca]|jgi:CheY-like chemotaxis protein|uniref:Chemotaxis protein CheY n=1 Tax=Kouleothrix aurantiaca TaxID=186479 RepID=A0A0P9CT64_9CHLR|nr:chemotaxis protein CheY [Kouleothrix aurantiaca]